MGIQVIITADNHLDPIATSFGVKGYEKKRDHLRCFQEVIEYAKSNRPDFLLMGGDIFDTIRPNNPVRANVMQWLKELYEIGVRTVMVGGHHDMPKSAEEGASPLAIYGNSGYAIFLQDVSKPTTVLFQAGSAEVAITGLGYNPLLSPAENPLSQTSPKIKGDINILLLHYPIEGFVGVYRDEPVIRLRSIPQSFQLVAAGHLHRYQKKEVGSTTIVCPGSTERISFAEENEPKGFVWAEVEKDGVISVEHIRTHAREYKTVEMDFPQKDPVTIIKQELEKYVSPELVLRIRLKGVVTPQQLASYKRSDLLLYGQDKFFYLFVDDSGLEIEVPQPHEALQRTTPLEELRRYFKSALERAPPEEMEIIQEALKLSERMLLEAGAW